jgi:hypothetical protein
MIQANHQTTLNLDEVFEALQRPLALIDDQQRRDEMQHFLDAARIHQERAIFDLISDIVARVNEAAPDTRVRLEYRSRQLHLAVDSNTVSEEDAADPMMRMDGDLEKVTIRLPKALKEQIDQAAGERGVSLNSWYVRTLARAIFRQMRGHRGDDAHREPAFAWPGRRGRRRRGESSPGGRA